MYLNTVAHIFKVGFMVVEIAVASGNLTLMYYLIGGIVAMILLNKNKAICFKETFIILFICFPSHIVHQKLRSLS